MSVIMEDEELQQFSLRWHNHQSSILGALGHMLSSGALSDVILSASDGVTLRAHRLVLAACSDYFAKIFKEMECENGAVVMIVECGSEELRALLQFMYTGEVVTSRRALPPLLRLARTLHVYPLTEAHTNSTLSRESPGMKDDNTSSLPPSPSPTMMSPTPSHSRSPTGSQTQDDVQDNTELARPENKDIKHFSDVVSKTDRLRKLDQIVQNLYSSHRGGILQPPPPLAPAPTLSPLLQTLAARPNVGGRETERRARGGAGGGAGGGGSVCGVCGKRLSNQYNLRVHMETHDDRRHACRACSHVSRSRDALRKHVAYRHAHTLPHAHATHARTHTHALNLRAPVDDSL